MENKQKPKRFLLWLSVIMMVIGLVGASIIQSDFGHTKIETLQLQGPGGKRIYAKMFIPDDASADHKLPLILAQHGAQHNYQMQDMNYIELSRRGYIVVAVDAYGHGNSGSREGLSREEAFTTDISVIDYIYDNLNYVDLDKIGLVGHSMGASYVSTTLQHYTTEEALGNTETNHIAACLEVGYDPAYEAWTAEGVDGTFFADADWGVIAGKYDEYFFRQPDANNDPAEILKSQAAVNFINQVDPSCTGEVENHKIYKGEINGKEYIRVYNQNVEIHPMNVFSSNTARDTIDFFYASLGVPNGHEMIASSNQTWLIKQLFNLLALIGLITFLFPFSQFIMDNVPYFGKLRTGEKPKPAPALDTPKKKRVFWITYVINTALPAVLAMPVCDVLIGHKSFTPTTGNRWFGDGAASELGGWALIVAACLLLVFYLNYRFFGKKWGADSNNFGFKASADYIFRSFLLALLTYGVMLAILYSADAWLHTDFRFWLIAIKPYSKTYAWYWIAYLPAFIAFYLVNSLLVEAGNRVEGKSDKWTTVVSCLSNAIGIAVLISIQYIVYVNTRTFTFNAMRTHNLFPMVVVVPVATIVCRKFFKETGKIYLGAFEAAMIVTIITICNTAMSYSLFG